MTCSPPDTWLLLVNISSLMHPPLMERTQRGTRCHGPPPTLSGDKWVKTTPASSACFTCCRSCHLTPADLTLVYFQMILSINKALSFPWFLSVLSAQSGSADCVSMHGGIVWHCHALCVTTFLSLLSPLSSSLLCCLLLAHCRVGRDKNELQQPADDVPWAGQQPWLQRGGGLQLIHAAPPGWPGLL